MSGGTMSNRLEMIRMQHDEAEIALRGPVYIRRVHPHDAPEWALDAHDHRRELLAEVKRQARHIAELQEKIDAEKSCACSYDAPGDVCAAHSPALAAARAEVERLRATLAKKEDGR